MKTKNSFFSFKAAFAACISLFISFSAAAQDAWVTERQKAKDSVLEDRLEIKVSFLADTLCQGRGLRTRGHSEAAMWVQRQFEDAGMIPFGNSWFRHFHVEGRTYGRNVIGLLPSARTIPCDRYIIVGAHYDHLGTLGGKMYPGADANASGVVAMATLADMFGQMRKMGKILGSNIIFVAFDAKELDMKGSQSLWDMLEYGSLRNPLTGEEITKEKIALMVNIDQIGSTLAPVHEDREDYLIMLGTQSLKRSDRNLLASCNTENGINLDIALDYYGSENFTNIFYRLSDQKVFVDNRIPAVLFTSGITMNNNKDRDTVETLNMEVFRKRIWLMYHWLEKML